MLRVALTHDVDRTKKTYQYITHSIAGLLKFDFNPISRSICQILRGENPYWGFDKIIDIEMTFNVRSTFFFLNESISFNLFSPKNWQLSLGRYNINEPALYEIIQFLDRNGWEIGLHGSYNSFKDENLLRNEKITLERIVGKKIVGIRQHYLNLNKDSWEKQRNVGLLYDSSWGFNNKLGYKDDKYLPFYPFNDAFTVFPLVIMDISLKPVQRIIDQLDYLIDLTEKENGILVVNWHTNYFDESEFPEFSRTYISIIEKCLERSVAIKTLSGWYEELNGNGKFSELDEDSKKTTI